MKALSAVLLAVVLGLAGYTAPAWAKNLKSFVSATGLDTDTCAITAPCATMGQALTNTFSGGMVSCLDSGDYTQTVTITTTITIDCSNTTAGAGPFIVTGAGIDVTIKHVFFFQDGFGIKFTQGASLHVEDVLVSQCTNGIEITASGPVGSIPKFVIANSTLHANGISGEEAGILIKPTAAGFVMGEVSNTIVDDNLFGIIVDGNGGATGINVSILNTTAVNNVNDGVHDGSNSAGAFVLVDHSTVSHNGGTGISAAGLDS
jgi:hypothetical protein